MTTPTRHGTPHPRARDPEPLDESHQLAAGAIFGVAISRQACITCVTGELWVTGPDTGDRILAPGQTLCVHGAGRLVVEALTPSRFETRA